MCVWRLEVEELDEILGWLVNRYEMGTYLVSYASQRIYVARSRWLFLLYYLLRSKISSRVCISRCDCAIGYEFPLLNKRYNAEIAKFGIPMLIDQNVGLVEYLVLDK
jgi:hypothetical protein